MSNETKKKPLGIIPKWAWIEHRLIRLNEAINRYLESGHKPRIEWYEEYHELTEWLANYKKQIKNDESAMG